MERVATRAGIWFAIMLLALLAAANAADSGFAAHMVIVAVAAAVGVWVTDVERRLRGACAGGPAHADRPVEIR